jgi:hypothetical protein
VSEEQGEAMEMMIDGAIAVDDKNDWTVWTGPE